MDVSVVILSYNVKDLLRDCVESVVKFSKGVDYEIIVVDSGSSDGSPGVISELSRKYKFKTILSKENLGYTKGNNVGMAQTKGDYILVLNPDTLFLEDTLTTMKKWMDGHLDVAVSSCQLLDSEHQISPTGGYFPDLLRVFAWAFFLDDLSFFPWSPFSYHPHVGPMYKKEFFPDWVTGAFFLVRRKAMEKVGFLDEELFLYGEELEWCMRFKQAGWKVGYTPVTKIVHLERRSSGGLPRNAVLGEFKGLKYIYGKHFPGWQQIVLGSLLDVTAAIRVIYWLVRLKPEMAKVYLEALLL